MREINSKEFAARVDDCIANQVYNMLVKLMTEFEQEGFLKELSPLEENHIIADTEEAAEILKEHVYLALVTLGLDVMRAEELRSCPRCGSESFSYLEIVDNAEGDELHDQLECDECGCRYYLVFKFEKKEEA